MKCNDCERLATFIENDTHFCDQHATDEAKPLYKYLSFDDQMMIYEDIIRQCDICIKESNMPLIHHYLELKLKVLVEIRRYMERQY